MHSYIDIRSLNELPGKRPGFLDRVGCKYHQSGSTIPKSPISIMRTIRWDGGVIITIDQTLLPVEYRAIECKTVHTLCEAIVSLRIRCARASALQVATGSHLRRIRVPQVRFQSSCAISRSNRTGSGERDRPRSILCGVSIA